MKKNDEWHDCDGIGIIKVYDTKTKKTEPIELCEDYDERLKGETQWKWCEK